MSRFLDRFDAAWTRIEVALCAAISAALASSLAFWVALKGLSSRTTETYWAGLAFRSLAGALLLGALARWATRKIPGRDIIRNSITAAAIALGLAGGWLWRELGVEYFGNLLGWLQDGSSLTLVGGLRGLGTRLTLWLALLGASLAAASGRHACIDAAPRALGEAARGAASRAAALLAAFICLITAWGFFDFTAVDAFGAAPDSASGAKVAELTSGVSRHLFLARRQLALDARMLGRVLAGNPWDRTLTAEQWNDWLRAGDWASYFGPEATSAMRETDSSIRRAPLLSSPGEPARGLLVKSLNLIIPFGLFMLALRFLLWAVRGGSQASGGEADPTAAAGEGEAP